LWPLLLLRDQPAGNPALLLYINLFVYTPPDNSPGILQGVLLSLSMALLLLALMVLVQWLHHSVQESKWRNSHEENEGYNEVKRSFI
ncbi:hypothetical protein cypCar_00024199, partial [Cyprinus carpio]